MCPMYVTGFEAGPPGHWHQRQGKRTLLDEFCKDDLYTWLCAQVFFKRFPISGMHLQAMSILNSFIQVCMHMHATPSMCANFEILHNQV
jgi:hypothetical protein